jgi:dGTPase
VLGDHRGSRFRTLVHDVIAHSDVDGGGHIRMSPEVHEALLALREFLYLRVYENPVVHDEFAKAQRILRDLWDWCRADEDRLAARFGVAARPGEPLERAVTDWLSGMTDRFALATWEALFLPRPWDAV